MCSSGFLWLQGEDGHGLGSFMCTWDDTTVPMTMCTRSYLRRQWWGSFTKSVMLGSLTTPTSVPYKVREVVSSKD